LAPLSQANRAEQIAGQILTVLFLTAAPLGIWWKIGGSVSELGF